MKNVVLFTMFFVLSLISVGQDWQPVNDGGLSGGTYPMIKKMLSSGDSLYVCGYFDSVGTFAANNVAVYTDTGWAVFGAGVPYRVFDMAIYKGDLYIAVDGVMRWDGTSWSEVGSSSVMGKIMAIESYGDKLYMLPEFNTGNPNRSVIWSWDGSNLVDELQLTNTFRTLYGDMEIHNGELVIGTVFTSAKESSTGQFITANTFIKYDGTNWSGLGGSGTCSGEVYTLESDNGTLYAGGSLTQVDGVTVNSIAKFESGSWSTFGSGTNSGGIVLGIYATASSVYIGGYFTQLDGVAINNSARYDGSAFYQFGTVDDIVTSFADYNSSIFAGGRFKQAGGQHCGGIAKMDGLTTGIDQVSEDDFNFYPNPTSGTVHMRGYSGEFIVYSSLGSEVLRGSGGSVDLSGLKEGIYFIRTENTPGRHVILSY